MMASNRLASRSGGTRGDNSTPKNRKGKRRWYSLEEPARHVTDPDSRTVAGPVDTDIRGLIAAMPARAPFVQHMPGELRTQQDKPHLWPIAVSNDDVPALGNHLSDVYRCFTHGCLLVVQGLVSAILNE